ncbi:MAG: hypothetical protein RI988_79 [Pseudomonadota bacterium]
MNRFSPRAFVLAALATTLTIGGTAALAQDTRTAYEPMAASPAMARVLAVTPNLERVTDTRQQCTEQQQQVTTPGQAGLGTTLAGSLIGGAIASPLGKGSGKAVAVATGSAIGSHVARNMAEQQATTTTKTVQVCQPVTSVREQVRDYAVRYEWEGREYVVNLPQHPGAWLKVTTSHSVQAM